METATQLFYPIAVSFAVYFLLSYAYKILRIRNVEQALMSIHGLLLINLKHGVGILIFGLCFVLVAPEFRFLISDIELVSWEIVLLFILTLGLSIFVSYKSVLKKLQTDLQKSHYGFNSVWSYFSVRILFLFAYEFFFRGIIFFSFLNEFNLVIAIALTTILYVIIHGFDSRNEILGAIPFGIVLCLFSYFTNSIWFAFIIHFALSSVYEYSIFKRLTIKKTRS